MLGKTKSNNLMNKGSNDNINDNNNKEETKLDNKKGQINISKINPSIPKKKILFLIKDLFKDFMLILF